MANDMIVPLQTDKSSHPEEPAVADDIVEVLRKGGHKINGHHCEICDAYCFRFELCECCWAALGRTRQAADEIERLRALGDQLAAKLRAWAAEDGVFILEAWDEARRD